MSRFIIDGSSYIPTKLSTEDQFERLLLKHGPDLFPHGHLVDWKPKAKSPSGEGTQPDLLLFSKDLSSWWIVEVEIMKNRSYVIEHIAKQLSKQSDANWASIIKKLLKPLRKLGYSKKDAEHLGSLEPNFLLITDGYDDLAHEVARTNNFGYMVAEPLMSEASRYGLIVTKEGVQMHPPSTGVFFDIGYGPGNPPDLAGGWWVELPKRVIDALPSDEFVVIEVDGHRHSCNIHELATTWKVAIPYSLDDAADSNRVLHKTADARFHLIEDPNGKYLEMAIHRRWHYEQSV